MSDAIKLFIRQAYMEVQPQWACHPRHDRLPRPAPVGATQQFANQPAVGDRLIAVALARCPPRGFCRQGIDHQLPVVQRLGGQHFADGGQPGLVAEQLAQRDRVLASSGKLRPVLGYRRIELELAFGHQLQGSHCREGLGAGEQVDDGIAVPGLGTVLVGSTGPQVDDGLPADLDAQPGTTLLRIIEQGGEGFAHRFELQLVMTLNLHLSPLGKHHEKWSPFFQPL